MSGDDHFRFTADTRFYQVPEKHTEANQIIDNRQSTIDNRQSTIDHDERQSTIDNRQSTIDNRQSTIDHDERLREGKHLGTDYFDELLERIRDIRASEKRFYQKIRDLYTLSIDYDPKAEATQEFFAIVQNKPHWAVTGRTAAELIAERADARKPNLGLTSWKGAKVCRGDVTVAKNYLASEEIAELNRALGLIALKTVAIDGTKIKANAASRRLHGTGTKAACDGLCADAAAG